MSSNLLYRGIWYRRLGCYIGHVGILNLATAQLVGVMQGCRKLDRTPLMLLERANTYLEGYECV